MSSATHKALLDTWTTGTVSLESSQVSGVACLYPARQENQQPLSFTVNSSSFQGLNDLSHLTLCNILETQNSAR
nr:hypothetical protein [Candidatus Mycoplasma haematolamae]